MYNRNEKDKKVELNEYNKKEDELLEQATKWIRPQTMEQ